MMQVPERGVEEVMVIRIELWFTWRDFSFLPSWSNDSKIYRFDWLFFCIEYWRPYK